MKNYQTRRRTGLSLLSKDSPLSLLFAAPEHDISKERERLDPYVKGLKNPSYKRKENIIKVPDVDKHGQIIPGKFTEYPESMFLLKYHGRYKNTNIPNLLHDFQIKVTEKNINGKNVEKTYSWEEFKKKHKNWKDYMQSRNSDMDKRTKKRYYVVEEYKKPKFLNEAQEEYLFQHKKRRAQEKEEKEYRDKVSKENKKFAKEVSERNQEKEKFLRNLSKEERQREKELIKQQQRQSGKMGAHKMARSERSASKRRTPEDDEKTIEEAPRRTRKKSQSPKKKSASPIEKRKKTGGRTADEKSRRRAYSNWIKNQRRPYPPDKDKVYNSMEDSDFDKLKEAIDEKFFEDIHKEWGSDIKEKIIKFICEYTNGWNKKGREKYC